MKKNVFYLLGAITLIMSCGKEKKELSEKEVVKEIKVLTSDSILSKEKFKTQLLPLLDELKEKDSVKYIMISHIANKIEKEKNGKISQLNYNDLRSEIKLIN